MTFFFIFFLQCVLALIQALGINNWGAWCVSSYHIKTDICNFYSKYAVTVHTSHSLPFLGKFQIICSVAFLFPNHVGGFWLIRFDEVWQGIGANTGQNTLKIIVVVISESGSGLTKHNWIPNSTWWKLDIFSVCEFQTLDFWIENWNLNWNLLFDMYLSQKKLSILAQITHNYPAT